MMVQSIQSYEQSIVLKLSNQKNLILYQDRMNKDIYYYRPTNLRLSFSDRGPEFSYITYNNQGQDQNPNAGIMHMLLVWGLDKDQCYQVNQYLSSSVDSQAYLAGSIPLVHDIQSDLEIYGNSDLVDILRRSLTSSSKVPLTPGNKMALSFKFSNDDFMRFDELSQNSNKMHEVVFRIYLKSVNYKGIDELSNRIILEARLSELLKDLI